MCVRCVWCVWVVGVQGGASAPPILNIHPEELLKRLDHRRASQDRATSSVEQPCHEAAQAPAAQTSMSARAQSASACANRSTRLACPPPQHPTCRGVRTGTLYACRTAVSARSCRHQVLLRPHASSGHTGQHAPRFDPQSSGGGSEAASRRPGGRGAHASVRVRRAWER